MSSEEKKSLISVISSAVAGETMDAFKALKLSSNKEVVELHDKIMMVPFDETVNNLPMIVEQNNALLPSAKAAIALSNLVDVEPEPIIAKALSILDNEPTITKNDLAKKLLIFIAKKGSPGKISTKLAKEMIKEGWVEINEQDNK